MVDAELGTTALATSTGYSGQQIRDLEALGVIAPARRAANGYRRFSAQHVRDLRVYRDLALAIGPGAARRGLRELRTTPLAEAVAMVGEWHLGLNRERDEALAARRALRAISAEAALDAEPSTADTMTITELADALGLRASTLRFWEKVGLLAPERVRTRAGSARRYPLPAIRAARITAALRAAGYRIPDVQRALAALTDLHDVDQPLAALAARLDAIAARTLALLRAGSAIAEIITAGQPTAGSSGSR
jgi:DNA-binding transcriptional MerR regulator